jgi:uncharacterized protein VirK/YbjX
MGEQKFAPKKNDANPSKPTATTAKAKSSKARDNRPARGRYTIEKRWMRNKIVQFLHFLKTHPNWKAEDQHPGLNADFVEGLKRFRG